DAGGIHFDLTMFGEQALPERLPLPNESIAYIQLKENGNSLINVEIVNSGIRLSTNPGQPVKLVMPALQFNEAVPPELGVEFSITVDPIGLQLRDGRIAANVPENVPGFDLSQLGIPINIKKITYQDISGIKTFALKGLPAFMGETFHQVDSLLMAVEENGRIIANLDLDLNKNIPLISGTEMVLFNLKTIQGNIDCSVNDLNFNLQASSAIKMEMNGAPEDVAVFNMAVSETGFSITDVDMAPGVDDLSLNLGIVDMKLSNFTIPVLSYDKIAGWDFAFDFNVNMSFPDLGDFELPEIEHLNISKTGLSIPQTSLPNLDVSAFELGGFSLKPLAFRIPGVEINIFEGSFDFGALSDFKFDFELNMPNLTADLPPDLANIGLTVSNCDYIDGILTGNVQPKNINEPGIPVPLGSSAVFYANLFQGSLYGENGAQRFAIEIGGKFQLPPGLFPCAEPTEIASMLRINYSGQIAGAVSGFVPNCPLNFGPVTLTVNSSNLVFEINDQTQSAILDMEATLKLPAPQEGDSITAVGNIAIDLIQGDFINGQIVINTPFSLNLPMDGDLLNFTINYAVLNPQGLSISGSNTLNLGQNSVSCSFTNFTMGLNPFEIRSGSVSFSSSFAFKLGIENGNLNWNSTILNPEISEDFAVALNLPP
ncbi:MAG: hypothetical protein KAR38_17695, partial [Calditrichia bacterium]|nr:hypothetical protein [Calditrichia bacterium]